MHWTAVFVVTALVYFLLDRGSRVLAGGRPYDTSVNSLALAALSRNPIPAIVVLLAAIGVMWAWSDRCVVRWTDVTHGKEFRRVVGLMAVVLVFRFGLYDYDWIGGRWHLADRAILIGLAVAIWWRPVMMLPFIVMVRIMSSQFEAALLSSPSTSEKEASLVVVIAIAACLIVSVASGRPSLDIAPLFVASVIVAQFWMSGLFKLRIGWLRNHLERFPRNGYVQGWLGHTDGSIADRLFDMTAQLGLSANIVILLFELGFAFALFHRRTLVFWLAVAPMFHGFVLLANGFVFLDWVIVELTLAWLLCRRLDDRWLAEVWTPRRAIPAFIITIGPSLLLYGTLHLAWFDTNVVYAYEVTAVTESGERLVVDRNALSPHDDHLVWGTFVLGPSNRVAAAYGVTTVAARYDQLEAIGSFSELEALEMSTGTINEVNRARSIAFFARFVEASAGPSRFSPSVLPPVYLASRPGVAYESGLILWIEITQVTTLHVDDEVFVRRELAAVVGASGELDEEN